MSLLAAACPLDSRAPPVDAGAWCRDAIALLATAASRCERGTIDFWTQALLHDRGRLLDCDGMARAGDRVAYDARAAAACLDALGKSACPAVHDLLRRGEIAGGLPGCFGLTQTPPVRGTVATDAACVEDWECAGGACDRTAGCPGLCAVRAPTPVEPAKGVGELCATVPDDCEYGLYCARVNVPTCAVKLDAGACLYDEQCAPGAHCLAGACAPWRALGEPCTDGECELGLRCDGGSCVATARVGEPCLDRAPWCLEGWCDGRTCQPHTPLWGDCRNRVDECGPFAVCAAPPYAGASGYCAPDPCRVPDGALPPRPDMADPCGTLAHDGARCRSAADCCSGYCTGPDCEGNRFCVQPPAACLPLGRGCAGPADCCSGSCGTTTLCRIATVCR